MGEAFELLFEEMAQPVSLFCNLLKVVTKDASFVSTTSKTFIVLNTSVIGVAKISKHFPLSSRRRRDLWVVP